MNRFKTLMVALCLLSISLPALYAQAGRGKARLSGEVTDELKNPVEGAEVVLEPIDFKTAALKTKSNKKGKWAFMGLGSGNWKVVIVAEGFIRAEQKIYISQLERNPLVEIALKKASPRNMEVSTDTRLLDEGNGLFQEGKYDEALEAYRKFLEANPGAVQAQINIGNCFREKGEYDKAFEAYNVLLEELKAKNPDLAGNELAAKAYAALGEAAIKSGDQEKAQEAFKQSLAVNPKDEVLAYNVGEIYFGSGNVDEAIRYFDMASRIKPDWPDPFLKLGFAYLNKQDFGKASEFLKKYLELAPQASNAEEIRKILASLKT